MRYRLLAAAAVGAVVSLLVAPRVDAADTWVEVKSPHFTVISDAGERAARSAAFDWEQLRIAIHAAWPWARVDLDRPVLVIAVKNEHDMKAFAPQFWEQRGSVRPAAIGTGGVDQHSFLIRADLSKDDYSRTINPYFSAYWTYVSTILDVSVRRPLPLWLADGIAAVMANSIVGGQTLQIGKMMQGYVATLHNAEHPTIGELMTIDRGSPWYTQANRRNSFDAMSWAFTHFLLFGEEGAHREKFQQFIDLLVQGKSASEALQGSLGDVSQFTNGFAGYINRATWPFSQLKADMGVPASAFTARTMTTGESLAARARFHLEMGRVDEARAAIDAAKKAEPAAAAPYDVDGLLAERERRIDDAMAAWSRAMELGSKSFYSYYRWAAQNINAARTDAALRGRVTTAAERAAILDNLYAPGLAQLALVTRMNGNTADAVAYARRAAELAPDNPAIQRVLDDVKR